MHVDSCNLNKLKMDVILHLGLLCMFAQQAIVLGSSDEAKLMEHLLSRYREEHRYTRPVDSASDTLEVSIGLTLIDIQDFDFDTGRGEFYFFDKWLWNDVHLDWDPSEFGGLKSIRIPIEKIWSPDIVMYNNQDMTVDRLQPMAKVDSNGDVLWVPRSKYHDRCMEEDDDWNCEFKLGSWVYDGNMILPTLYQNESKVDLSSFKSEHRWEVVENTAVENMVKYECCPEPYPNILFSLKLKSLVAASSSAAVTASACLALLVAAVGRALWI